jgi:fatty-acyl-CoA synthase
VLCDVAGVLDAVVFGIPVPDAEGRAGMAALTVDERFSFATLRAHVDQHLPDYAQPLFIRLCPAIDRTGTFKLIKTQLAREGCETTDPIWRRETDQYRPLSG